MTDFVVKKNLQIAIDGPVASGKSTVASIIAKKLGILYVYTGAMYRAVGFLARKSGLLYQNEKEILNLLKKTKITLKPAAGQDKFCRIFLNNQEVTDQLFTQEASQGSSAVAVHPKIRSELVLQQKKIARGQSVVMEGRDITTRVLPKADLKIYMTADLKVRAERRLEQMSEKGIEGNVKNVIEETKKRDYQDSHRKADPLKIVADDFILDTTNLSINEVVDKIIGQLIIKKLIQIKQ